MRGVACVRPAAPAVPDARPEREEGAQEPAAAIEALPRKERLVLTLSHKEGLRRKEIAGVLPLSVARVSRPSTKATFEPGEALKQKRGRDFLARYGAAGRPYYSGTGVPSYTHTPSPVCR